VKLPLEYDSRRKHNASRSVHCLIIHAFIGDCPYRGMRIGDRVPSPKSFSHSVLVQIHSEIFIVPNNCGAMQFPVGKLAETLEGMMFVLRFELTEPLSHRIDAFSFIVGRNIVYYSSLILKGGRHCRISFLEHPNLHVGCRLDAKRMISTSLCCARRSLWRLLLLFFFIY
jgi:hypothetical protein